MIGPRIGLFEGHAADCHTLEVMLMHSAVIGMQLLQQGLLCCRPYFVVFYFIDVLVILCKIELQLTMTTVPTKPATDRPRIDIDDCICTIDHGAWLVD